MTSDRIGAGIAPSV